MEQLEEAEPVSVPLVEGLQRELAVQRIEAAGLEAAVEEEPSTEVETNVVIEQSPPEGTRISKGDTVTIVVSSGPRQVEVPRVVGLTYDEAVSTLENLGLRVRRVDVFSQRPVGQVTAQNPRQGTQVDEGTRVTLRVSQGVEQVAVPDVLNQSEASARAELDQAGFEVEVVQAPSSTTPEGLVSAQNPDPGVEAARGSTVQITVSTGPEEVPVPDVVGEDEATATQILEDAGFSVRVQTVPVLDPDAEGIVQDQDPPGQSDAEPGSRVTIFVGDFPDEDG
jgi:serine/threonine-protein kinase